MWLDRRVNRRERALAIADGRTLVSDDPATVAWLTGVAPDRERGNAPFFVPPVVVLDERGIRLVVSADQTAGIEADVEPVTVTGFVVEDVDRKAEAAALLRSLVRGRQLAGDLTAELTRARAVKDPDEIDGIRAAVATTDAGQAAARAAFAAGATELDVWAAVRAAMERDVGERIPILGDLITGPRTGGIGGAPTSRVIQENDLLLVDLGPRVGGWWSDSCATVALGEPPAHVREAHAAALEALAALKRAVRPGALSSEIDATARAIVDFPHHTGHGVGRSVHEEPRIIPGADRVLEAGMVIALEPGTYGDDWGVRVEQLVLVTDGGCEALSRHDLSLVAG
jgi:Xaa-Pro aminopeptidase